MELFRNELALPELTDDDLDGYVMPVVSDEEKNNLLSDFAKGCHQRIPVTLDTNYRVAIMDRRFCCGLDFQEVFTDPKAMTFVLLMAEYYRRMRYNHFCNSPTALPGKWEISIDFQVRYFTHK